MKKPKKMIIKAMKRQAAMIILVLGLVGLVTLFADIGIPAGERGDFSSYPKYIYGDYSNEDLSVFLDSATMKTEILPDGTTSYYWDLNLIPGNTYYYWYKAKYGGTEYFDQKTPVYRSIYVPLSGGTTVWDNWADGPLPPENLTGIAVPVLDSASVCNINLSWASPKFGNDNLLDYSGVEIWRSSENVTFSTDTWQWVYLSNMLETSFTDHSLPIGATVYYAFRSYDAYQPPRYSSAVVIAVNTGQLFQPVRIKFVLDMYGQDEVKNVYLASDFTTPAWLPSLYPLEKTAAGQWKVTVYDPANSNLLLGRKISYRYVKNNDVWEKEIPINLGGPNRQLLLSNTEMEQNDVWSVPGATSVVNLPPGIVGFAGFYSASGVELFWKVDPKSTATISGFFVERSSYSATAGFEPVSPVLGPDTFYYLDTTATAATLYYRLAEKTIAPATDYSEAIRVSPETAGLAPAYSLWPLTISDFTYIPGPDTGQITIYFRAAPGPAELPIYEYILSYATYPVQTLADWYRTKCAGKFRAHLSGVREYFVTVDVGDNCPGYYFSVAARFSGSNYLGLSQNILAVAPKKIDARLEQVVTKKSIALGDQVSNYQLQVKIPAKTFPSRDYLVVIKNGRELLLDTSTYQNLLAASQKEDRRIQYLTDIQNKEAIVPFYQIEIFGLDGKNYFAEGGKLNRNLEISFPYGYLDTDSDGLIDPLAGQPAFSVDKLQIAVFNETGKFWRLLKDTPGQINRNNQTVNFSIDHLSIFGLFGVPRPAEDLSGVVIYPNPFKPTDGILENGEYGAGADYEYIRMINLTLNSEVYIYNIAGEIVRHNNLPVDLTGEVRWDGKNDDGNYCASGLYLVLIKDEKLTAGKNKFLGKVAIVR